MHHVPERRLPGQAHQPARTGPQPCTAGECRARGEYGRVEHDGRFCFTTLPDRAVAEQNHRAGPTRPLQAPQEPTLSTQRTSDAGWQVRPQGPVRYRSDELRQPTEGKRVGGDHGEDGATGVDRTNGHIQECGADHGCKPGEEGVYYTYKEIVIGGRRDRTMKYLRFSSANRLAD